MCWCRHVAAQCVGLVDVAHFGRPTPCHLAMQTQVGVCIVKQRPLLSFDAQASPKCMSLGTIPCRHVAACVVVVVTHLTVALAEGVVAHVTTHVMGHGGHGQAVVGSVDHGSLVDGLGRRVHLHSTCVARFLESDFSCCGKKEERKE